MNEIRIIPLGGLGRIGGNLMVYETPVDLFVVDCGMLFPTAEQPGVDYLVPDTQYIAERRHKLRAYVITHGHEDHIGALTHVHEKLPAPIYATGFTLGLIENKFSDRPDSLRPELVRIRDGVPFKIGSDFVIEPIPVTHSIPDAVALAITTPVGIIIQTGDFKVDDAPLDGRLTGLARLRELGDRGVIALLSDSTNAERPGRTWSERRVAEALHRIIGEAPHRVCLTMFSSNMHRVQAVIDASVAAGRSVMPVGRSVQQNIQMALERGYLKAPHGALADTTYYESVPRSHLTIIASGSQGEPQAAMTRIAARTHPHVKLDPHDRVVWSSRHIPGNELAISAVVNNLLRSGIDLVDDHTPFVHTSGHAFADELGDMLAAVRPRYFVPVHGEYKHMVAHARIAERTGVPPHAIYLIEDGQPLLFTDTGVRRDEPVNHGHNFVEGEQHVEVGEVVLRDRRILADTGMVVVVAVRGPAGELVTGPEIAARGVLHMDGAAPSRGTTSGAKNEPEARAKRSADLIDAVKNEARNALLKIEDADDEAFAEEMRVVVRRFFRNELGKRPLVVPLVMRV